MADFSLTTLFVVPVGVAIASANSTQDLTAGQVGFFSQAYAVLTSGTIAAADYFYIAQGRTNTYLQGSKRSDKIKGCPTANCKSNVTEFYKVTGCPTPINQIIDIGSWNVKCGDEVTLTIRAHSSYLDTLYFNGLTRSVTVIAPCCECGGDPCDTVDVSALIDAFIVKLNAVAPTSYFLMDIPGAILITFIYHNSLLLLMLVVQFWKSKVRHSLHMVNLAMSLLSPMNMIGCGSEHSCIVGLLLLLTSLLVMPVTL